MTERERIEREVILDILLESSRWERTDSDMDSIRAEVTDRARRLLGIDIKPSEAMSVIERGLARESRETPEKAKDASHRHTIRVTVDGKVRWVRKDQCQKVPCPHSRTGYKWAYCGAEPLFKEEACK